MEENRGSSRLNIRQPKHLAAMLQVSLNDLIEILDHASDYYQAYNNRGTLYLLMQDYVKAINDFDKAIILYKDYAFAYNNRGLAFAKTKYYEKAFLDFQISEKLNPNNVELYINMGDVYFELGNYKKAIENWKRALLIDFEQWKKLYIKIKSAEKNLN